MLLCHVTVIPTHHLWPRPLELDHVGVIAAVDVKAHEARLTSRQVGHLEEAESDSRVVARASLGQLVEDQGAFPLQLAVAGKGNVPAQGREGPRRRPWIGPAGNRWAVGSVPAAALVTDKDIEDLAFVNEHRRNLAIPAGDRLAPAGAAPLNVRPHPAPVYGRYEELIDAGGCIDHRAHEVGVPGVRVAGTGRDRLRPRASIGPDAVSHDGVFRLAWKLRGVNRVAWNHVPSALPIIQHGHRGWRAVAALHDIIDHVLDLHRAHGCGRGKPRLD